VTYGISDLFILFLGQFADYGKILQKLLSYHM
jgi:hypothetical protein